MRKESQSTVFKVNKVSPKMTGGKIRRKSITKRVMTISIVVRQINKKKKVYLLLKRKRYKKEVIK